MCVPASLPSTTQPLDTEEENTGPGHKPIMHVLEMFGFVDIIKTQEGRYP